MFFELISKINANIKQFIIPITTSIIDYRLLSYQITTIQKMTIKMWRGKRTDGAIGVWRSYKDRRREDDELGVATELGKSTDDEVERAPSIIHRSTTLLLSSTSICLLLFRYELSSSFFFFAENNIQSIKNIYQPNNF